MFFGFFFVIIFGCIGVLPACMSVYYLCAVLLENRRGYQVFLNLLQSVRNAVWGPRIEARTSDRVARGLNHGAVFPASTFLLF